jgi:hypothetical protein
MQGELRAIYMVAGAWGYMVSAMAGAQPRPRFVPVAGAAPAEPAEDTKPPQQESPTMQLTPRRLKLLGATLAATAILGGGAAIASTSALNLKAVKKVAVVRSSDASATSTGTWTDVPGSSVSITVPGAKGVVLSRFTGESFCTAGSWCSVRVLVDGFEAYPADGTDFAIDYPGNNYHGVAVDRSTNILNGGVHTVKLQYIAYGGGAFRLDDWHLTLEAVAADPPRTSVSIPEHGNGRRVRRAPGGRPSFSS